MAEVWLNGNSPGWPALDVVLRGAGIELVDVAPGYDWRRRSRRKNTSGFPAKGPYGVVVHHTASGGRFFDRDKVFCGVNHPDAPVGNLLLGPRGQVAILAAGAANTQGKGGPITTSRGVVPLNQGNGYLLAIEASNDGVGEPWPEPMQDAYVRMVAALCRAYGLNPLTDVISHHEWCQPSCPGRKWDPAGPSRWAPHPVGGVTKNLWRMDAFRQSVAWAMFPVPSKPDPEEVEVRPIRWQPKGYANQFLISEGGIVHLSPALAKHWEHVPLITEVHEQVLRNCLAATGLTAADLVRQPS